MPYQDTYDQTRNAFINRQQTIQQNAANQTAGNALANGDYTGATNALYRAGDVSGGQQIQQYSDTQRVQHAQAAQRISQGIRAAVQAGHSPQEAFAMAVQLAPQMGVDAADVAKLKPAFDQDPVGTLNMVDQQAKKELQFFQTDRGILAGDKATGDVKLAYGLPGKPVAMDPDKTYIQADGPVGPPGSPQPQTAPVAQPQATTTNAPRSVRNNNPLNVTTLGGGQQWNGQTGADGQFATFATPEAGLAAADKNLQAYGTKHGINTIAGVIQRWAPASENDTQGYIATVAKDLGVAPNQPLNLTDPAVRQRVLASMAKVEGGPASGAQVPSLQGGAGVDAVEPQPAPAGYHIIQRAQPGAAGGGGKWEVYTDPKTNTQFRYNPATHEATTLDGSPYTPGGLSKLAGGGQPRSAAALAAQRYIQEHPDATAEDVSQFNASLNKERSAAVAFGTGKQGQTINSMNVSIDHLSTLQDLSTALGNGDIQAINSVRQKWNTQTGKPAPTSFAAAKQIVGDEIVKGIVGSGGGVADREKAQAAISAASSPQQLSDVISTYKRLLAGQLNGLRLQYKNTTGRSDFEDKLLPETRVELEKLTPAQDQPSAQPAAANGYTGPQIATARQLAQSPSFRSTPLGQAGNPYAPRSHDEFEHLPVGASFINPADGRVLKKTH